MVGDLLERPTANQRFKFQTAIANPRRPEHGSSGREPGLFRTRKAWMLGANLPASRMDSSASRGGKVAKGTLFLRGFQPSGAKVVSTRGVDRRRRVPLCTDDFETPGCLIKMSG